VSPRGTTWNSLDLKPHGTPAAYRRHYRQGTPVCEACKQGRRIAREAYDASYQAAKRERYRLAREAGMSAREANRAASSPARFARAITLLREKRSPAVLCNPAFEAWLREKRTP